MERQLLLVLLIIMLLLTFFSCRSSSLSTDTMPICAGAPVFVLPEPLPFCGIVGPSCCDPAVDAALGEEFRAMNVSESDAACATIVQTILCQKCIPSPSPVNDVTIRSIPPRCASPRTSSAPPQLQGDAMCLERLAGGGTAYQGMAAHPDGSGRAFLYTQEGKIWIASVPARGSGAPMQVAGDGVAPFVDLTGRALLLLGLAPHPKFATNCRLFISYACDAIASPACGASSSAAAAARGYAGSSQPWRYQLVVEEFTANGVDCGMASRAGPTQVKKIFTMGMPQAVDSSNQRHAGGGQIFFRPGHGYLYLVTGNGGPGDEATSPFLGKIIRFDVGRSPVNEPQIFAKGINDPRGCSFDSKRPSYLYCAGVDENQQVYLISNNASNYSASPAATKAAVSVIIGHGRPTAGEAPSIVGGIVYRGPADPFLSGRYLYMYGSSMWAAAGTPNALRVYASARRIPNVRCSGSSPVPCGGVAIAGGIVSLAQDNSKDAFIITTDGIYRVIPPGLCGGGAPRPRARAPPLQNNKATSWLVWAASILGSAVTVPSAIYLVYLCLCGRRRGQEEGEEGGDPRATNSREVTLICCFRGILTNSRNNARPPTTGGQGGGSTTCSQVELQARVYRVV